MKIFYLNNPAAHGGKGAKYFQVIKNELAKRKIEFDSVQTEFAGQGTDIIKQLDFGEYDGIAVSGGDGTLFEVINGYFLNSSSKKIPIGIIPAGRGNAFARDLNLHPEKWIEAVEIIAGGKTKMVDVGLCKTENEPFYFINILGFGFVTDVAKTAFKLRTLGHLSYIIGVLYRTLSLKSYKLKIVADGKIIERENVFAEICNTRYTGKDFFMAPGAEIDDGLLDIILLNKLTRSRLLQALPKIFTGDHVRMKEVEYFKAKKINIDTCSAKPLTPDGQLFGKTPLQIECFEKTLAIFIK
jgi:diacylglycerol kinase (ATP)